MYNVRYVVVFQLLTKISTTCKWEKVKEKALEPRAQGVGKVVFHRPVSFCNLKVKKRLNTLKTIRPERPANLL